jgi:hypothetical protein
MTRRDFIYEAMVAAGLRTELKLTVPIRRVMDRYAQCTPEQLRRFWWSIWPEAVKDFNGGGIQLECSGATREIRRSPGGRPIFTGLSAEAINLVLTDHIPVAWDNGRAPGGMSACMRDTASAWLRSGMRTPIKSRSFRSTPVCMSYCRSARRHFCGPPDVVSTRRAGIANRLVCNPPMAVSRRRSHSEIRWGLPQPSAIIRGGR